jgi:hypothetical protein
MVNGISTSNLPNWSQVQNTQQANQSAQILNQFFAENDANIRQTQDVFSSMRERDAQARSELYEGINQDLRAARETVTQAVNFGNTLMDSLAELRDLATRYTEAAGDDETRNALVTQFQERVESLREFASENQPQNSVSVALRSGASSELSLNLTESRFDFSGISSLSIDNMNGLDEQLTTAARFTATAENFNTIADRQMRVNENLFAPRAATPPATPEALPEQTPPSQMSIEEMTEIAQGLNASIIQQAIDAMETQANVQQNATAWLL